MKNKKSNCFATFENVFEDNLFLLKTLKRILQYIFYSTFAISLGARNQAETSDFLSLRVINVQLY